MVGSSEANLFASVAAGVSALWGPLHGGANVAVVDMLDSMLAEGLSVKDFVGQIKDKKNGIRLMGFGHRVYKNYDPRAAVVKKTAYEVFEQMNVDDPLLDIALRLEEVALADEFFIERKLYPNVDFYSGIVLRALGIPAIMFTVMFAIGRMPGWVANWREIALNPKGRINRPRQIYQGPPKRDYIPMEDRS